MAESNETPETPEETPAPSPPTVYVLESTTRSRHNRTKRASVPGRQSFVHRIAGGRILVRRARPARISEAVLLAHLDEIKLAVSRHHLVVKTLDGRPVDLATLTAGASAAAASPRPNPPLDSAKNDKNENVGYNVPGAPEGTTLDAAEPAILREALDLDAIGGEEDGEDEGGEESDEVPATVPAETTATPVSKSAPPPQGRKSGKRGR